MSISASDGGRRSSAERTAPRISVVVSTLNEEARLPYALRSVRSWVDEVIVVDMESDDGTVEVARGFGAAVLSHPRVGYADPARSVGVDQATGEWVLILDADEVVPPSLARRLRELAARPDVDAVSIAWRNYLLGSPLEHTGWGPGQDRHIRFFRRGRVALRPIIHDYLQPGVGARIVELPASEELAVTHFNYTDLSHFLDKLDRYTTIEARAAIRDGRPAGPGRAVSRAVREFVARYIRRKGYRDGWRGFYLSALMATYRFVSIAKTDELRMNGPRSAVEQRYREEAERILAGYERDDRWEPDA